MHTIKENPPENMAGAYMVVNLLNGKKYIGISSNIKKRVSYHSRGKSGAKLLERAIKKYGHDSFLVIPLCYSISGTAHLPEIEAKLIELHKTCDLGYNIQRASGAVGPYGTHFCSIIKKALNTNEAKINMSNAQKKSKGTPEARAAQSIRSKEILSRADVILKRSISLKKALSVPETKNALISRIKSMQTDDFVKNRVEKQKATMATDEYKKKRSAASKAMQSIELKNKKINSLKITMGTDEYKLKRSIASKKMQTPELKEKKINSLKKTYSDPSVRAKISAARTGRVWITNGVDMKCVFPPVELMEGWRYGRK